MTLRKRLFLSVGAILLIVAAVNFALSQWAAGHYLDKASAYFHARVEVAKESLAPPLSRAEEAREVLTFIDRLGVQFREKLSFGLLGAMVLSFGIALVLLARLSKRMVRPIVQLARASEQLGEGRYEGLTLPRVEGRQDEIAALAHSFGGMVEALRDREKTRGVLNKVLSKEIAEELLRRGSLELGGEERVVTMLFSDIRGFTALSETLEPAALIALLNSYMTEMCRAIDETGGVVDKFVGDEIMALYGAPVAIENPAVRAVEGALQMLERLRRWNGGHAPPFTVGIGVHTGRVLSGNMGAENRLNYTVIGANVNLAARICGVAEPMQVLLSEATWREVEGRFRARALPPRPLKGVGQEVVLYALE